MKIGANQRIYERGLLPESDPPPGPKMLLSCSRKKLIIFSSLIRIEWIFNHN
jgi:hypothetical protein